MKTVVSCGDSFFTSTRKSWDNQKGHDWPAFSVSKTVTIDNLDPEIQYDIQKIYQLSLHNPSTVDIIAFNKNWQHINLAQGGANNVGIRLQIDKAIEDYKPDYIFFCASSPYRYYYRNEKGILCDTGSIAKLRPDIKKIYEKYFIVEELVEKQTYWYFSSAIELLERKGINYFFFPNFPEIRNMDWSWVQGKVYPNELPQLFDLAKLNPNNFINHTVWEDTSKVAEAALTLLTDWN